MSMENPKQPKQHPLVEAEKEIKEIEKRRAQYEKGASDIAENQNSFLENIIGRGIDKDDIMNVDALFENKLRDIQSERAELVAKSDLSIETIGRNDDDPGSPILEVLKGTINGKTVEIEFVSDEKGTYVPLEAKTLLDGRELNISDASKIVRKYIDVAFSRTKDIERLKEEKGGVPRADRKDIEGII